MGKTPTNSVMLLSIGDELLIGQTINTNMAWLGSQLNLAGFDVVHAVTVRDRREDILEALDSGFAYDLVISTGGLGPTADDITKAVICEFFNTELQLHEPTLDRIRARFALRGYELTERNMGQAMVPGGADILDNEAGTAPGIGFRRENTRFFFLPGVPFEMKYLLEHRVLPIIQQELQPSAIIHRVIMTHGVGESFLSDKLQDWEKGLPEGLSLAYLPSPGIVKLRLSARIPDYGRGLDMLNEEAQKLYSIIPGLIYGEGEVSLAEVIGHLLSDNSLTVSAAESCTGGSVSHMITSVPGSSRYFLGSVVAYANEVKTRMLGVREEDIERFGAVSGPVAGQMAEGVRKLSGSDFGLASSGIAGPDGGTEEKPVGLTYLAVAGPERTVVKEFRFGEHRGRNILRASLALLDMLRKEV